MAAAVAAASLHPDTDTDPRELEAFAERFKQRRIKLGKHLTRNSLCSLTHSQTNSILRTSSASFNVLHAVSLANQTFQSDTNFCHF